MNSPLMLWLPIIVSTVVVFVLSSLVHMVLPWHKGDYPRLPDEDAVMDALRGLDIPPGEYMVPRPTSPGDMKSPDFLARLERGPRFMLNMWGPGASLSMGGPLALWFVYVLVTIAFAGHIAQAAVTSASESARIFHEVALSSLMGFAFALWQMTIWYRRSWVITLKATIDGLLYALATGAIFVWLWPK